MTKNSLAAKYTPPPKPSYGVAAIAIVIGACLTLGSVLSRVAEAKQGEDSYVGIMMGVSAILIGLILAKLVPAQQKAWELRMEALQRLWVCKKCGHEWCPEEGVSMVSR